MRVLGRCFWSVAQEGCSFFPLAQRCVLGRLESFARAPERGFFLRALRLVTGEFKASSLEGLCDPSFVL